MSNSLNAWLGEKYGRAAALARVLAISRSSLTQVRKGQRSVPTDWLPIIQGFSNGVLTIEALVHEASRGIHEARRARKIHSAPIETRFL